MLTWPIDHSAVPATDGAAEGGFREGDTVVVRLPGDPWDGMRKTIVSVYSPRAVCFGPRSFDMYCVAALERASR